MDYRSTEVLMIVSARLTPLPDKWNAPKGRRRLLLITPLTTTNLRMRLLVIIPVPNIYPAEPLIFW
jgi:hypothetical protein